MSKLIAPPSITTVEALLDLLLNPMKVQDWLKQMRDLRDEVVQRLEQYEDKEYLADALEAVQEMKQAAAKELAEAKATAEHKVKEANATLDKANNIAADLKLQWESKLRDLQVKEKDIESRLLQLVDRETRTTGWETALKAREDRVVGKEQTILAKETQIANWMKTRPV